MNILIIVFEYTNYSTNILIIVFEYTNYSTNILIIVRMIFITMTLMAYLTFIYQYINLEIQVCVLPHLCTKTTEY